MLARMKRGYTREELYQAVGNIRREFPTAALSCDMICGFPGESESDFQDSVNFIRDCKILHAHVFPYSKREGTRAVLLDGHLDEKIKHSRAAYMISEAEKVSKTAMAEYHSKPATVLVEKIKGNLAYGYTEHFIYQIFENKMSARVSDVVEITFDKDNAFLE